MRVFSKPGSAVSHRPNSSSREYQQMASTSGIPNIYQLSSPDRTSQKLTGAHSPPQSYSYQATQAVQAMSSGATQSNNSQIISNVPSQQSIAMSNNKTHNFTLNTPGTLHLGSGSKVDHSKYNTKQKSLASNDTKDISPHERRHPLSSTLFQPTSHQVDVLNGSQKENGITGINVRHHVDSTALENKGTTPYGIQHLLNNNINNVLTSVQNQTTRLSTQYSQQQTSAIAGAQYEISKIAQSLRDILKKIQNSQGGNPLSDSLNDGVLQLLYSFRKLEEWLNGILSKPLVPLVAPSNTAYFGSQEKLNLQSELVASQAKCCELEKRTVTMSEDYQKLKAIMDSLQEKMTVLVQENSKLNKNLMEQDTKFSIEVSQRKEIKSGQEGLHEELSRTMRYLDASKRENEELRKRVLELDQNEQPVRRQLFDFNQNRLLDLEEEKKSLNVLYQEKCRVIEQLYTQNTRRQEDVGRLERELETCRKQLNSRQESVEFSRVKSGTKFEQLELKALSLQMENDNLKSEMAHHQIDNKAMETKQEMMGRLEERIRGLIKDKIEYEQAHDRDQVVIGDAMLSLQSSQLAHKKTTQQVSELSERHNALEKEFEQVRQQLSARDAYSQNLQKELVSRTARITQLEQEQVKEHVRLTELEEILLRDRKEHQRQICQAQQEVNDITMYLNSHKEKISLQIKEKDQYIERLQQCIDKFQEEKQKLLDRADQNEKYVESLNQSLQQQSMLQQQLLVQIDGLKQSEQQQRVQMEKSDKQWRNALELSQREIENQKNEINNYRNTINDQMNQLQKDNMVLREHIGNQQAQENNLNENISKLNYQLEVQKKLYTEANEDVQRRVRQTQQKHEELTKELQIQMNTMSENKNAISKSLREAEVRLYQCQQELDERVLKVTESLEQKIQQVEASRVEVEKLRSANYNLQEELLRAGMLYLNGIIIINSTQGLKQELNQARSEQENMIDLLKKRKDEATTLHESLDQARREGLRKQCDQEDGRRSILKQQDINAQLESYRREINELRAQLINYKNEIVRLKKESEDRENEIEFLHKKYDDAIHSLGRMDIK